MVSALVERGLTKINVRIETSDRRITKLAAFRLPEDGRHCSANRPACMLPAKACARSWCALHVLHEAQSMAARADYIGNRYQGGDMERADSAVLGYLASLLLLILAGIFLIPY